MGISKKFTLPVAAALLSMSSLGLAGCSSEPSYCDEVSATQSSFDALVSTLLLPVRVGPARAGELLGEAGQ